MQKKSSTTKTETETVAPHGFTQDGEPAKRGRGRPKGSTNNKRYRKLTPDSKTAKAKYYKLFGDLPVCAVYGMDTFTEDLIDYLWKRPDIEFVCTDPVEALLTNITRTIGTRPMSLYRFDTAHHVGFIEEGYYPVVVVASKYWEEVSKLPNPNKVLLVNLEEL